MRVRDSSKVRGQRTHVSTLIQSNVYNIITYVYVYNACDCMCFLPYVLYHERVLHGKDVGRVTLRSRTRSSL